MNKVLQKIIKIIGLGLLLVLLAACGNNSSNGDDPSVDESKWDEMVWDKDDWA
jgi:hypothetical protein